MKKRMERMWTNTKGAMGEGWHYKDVLYAIIATESKPAHIIAIMRAVIAKGINRQAIAPVVSFYGASSVSFFKEDILDLMISYLNIILDDHQISKEEYRDFGLLKLLFKIKEGDFYNKRFHQVESIMHDHLIYAMEGGKVGVSQALQTLDLKTMFGLGSDQYDLIEKHYHQKFKATVAEPIVTKKEWQPPIQNRSFVMPQYRIAKKPTTYKYQSPAPVAPPKKQSDLSTVIGVIIILILAALISYYKHHR